VLGDLFQGPAEGGLPPLQLLDAGPVSQGRAERMLHDGETSSPRPGSGVAPLSPWVNSSLLLVHAFLWKMTAVESRSVLQAKQWIQRIVVGTLGVELAGILVHVLTGSIPH
jgi:hypothetical protein